MSWEQYIRIWEEDKRIVGITHPHDGFIKQVPNSFIQMINAPMYRRDLDIVIEFKDGSLGASYIIWYDDQNKFGMFEPVGTHPKHQRKGLGKSALLAGLKR